MSSSDKGKIDDKSLHELAAVHHIDRRTNIRVKYPKKGAVGHLPFVLFEGHSVTPKNISIGGLCIEDTEDQFGQQVGQSVEVVLDWGDYKTKLNAKTVGVNLQLRHIQFIDIDQEALRLLKRIITPGYVAEKMRRVKHEESHLRLAAEEVWLADGGERILFLESGLRVELNLLGYEITISEKEFNIKKQRRASKAIEKKRLIQDSLLVLGHLNESSTCIDQLIDRLSRELPSCGSTSREQND